MPTNHKKIVLLGDSTLDNSVWVDSLMDTVAGKLEQKFQEPDQIIDLSCDGFTSRDVLEGAMRDKAVDSPLHRHIKYYPLTELKNQTDPTHIILSVGGNDLRENLLTLATMNPEERKTQLNLIISGIQKRYLLILNELKTIQPDASPVIMLQYTPDSTQDVHGIYTLMHLLRSESSMSYFTMLKYYVWGKNNEASQDTVAELHHLMKRVYAPILNYAKEHNIPIIDMASSLNHRDTSFYRQQIEPSAKGSEVIANLISHVVNKHDFSKSSHIYSQPHDNPDQIISQSNHESWKPLRYAPSSKDEAMQIFLSEYQKRLDKDNKSWFGLYSFFSHSQVKENMSFDQLVEHAQSGNNRSRAVMHDLEWLDNENQFDLKCF